MNHGSLFTGIGGFDLAAEWVGWTNIFQVENDKFCNSKLEKNFPNIKRYGDIREFNGTEYRGIINIITGGFPCQGFSVAGKQRGKSDPRWLWPEMLRVIREIQPAWVVGENVPGIIKLALEDICLALESEGYAVQPFIIPSASIGAWDKRERVWIIAYSDSNRKMVQRRNRNHNNKKRNNTKKIQERENKQLGGVKSNPEINPDIKSSVSEQSRKTWSGGNGYSDNVGNIISKGLQGYSGNDLSGRQKEQERQAGQANWLRNWIEIASELCGSNARVPHRMERIKALGNSVNPYVVFELFKAIETVNNLLI